MKKKYIKPYLEIVTGVLNASILAGSQSGGGSAGPGENDPTTPINPTPPPGGGESGPIVDAKKNFNAWENWDEY